MDPMLGQVILFAGNFAPRGWALCQGQLLPISQNSALFSILGTMYGGDGRTTFGLPDLRGRTPIGPGNGPGLPNYRDGVKGGSPTNTMTFSEMPPHTHAAVLRAKNSGGDGTSPNGTSLAETSEDNYSSEAPDVNMRADAITVANSGGGQAQNNMQPYQAINYIIALQGVYPSRS